MCMCMSVSACSLSHRLSQAYSLHRRLLAHLSLSANKLHTLNLFMLIHFTACALTINIPRTQDPPV